MNQMKKKQGLTLTVFALFLSTLTFAQDTVNSVSTGGLTGETPIDNGGGIMAIIGWIMVGIIVGAIIGFVVGRSSAKK